MKIIRCTSCRAEFADAEVQGACGCPACGSDGVPMAIAQDTTIRINWHELRILCIWAEWWAERHCGVDAQKTVRAIIEALEAQRPNGFPALSFGREIQEAVNHFGMKAELHKPDGSVETIRPKKPS